MKVNLAKTVVVCNGTRAKQKLWQMWRVGRLPPLRLATRDLGVGAKWSSWRNPVPNKRISTFHQSVSRVRALGLPANTKAWIVMSLYSVIWYRSRRRDFRRYDRHSNQCETCASR
eukprot:60932-Amphidinium_carterae.1